jgi:uncharacterized membrane protein
MPVKRITIIGAIVAVALSLPFFGHHWNLLMHQLGAILFMGNIVIAAVWLSLARRSRDAESLRFGLRGVVLTDALFTLPGSLLLLLNGGILGTPYFETGARWLFISIALFLLSAILWLAVLIPVQKRLCRLVDPVPRGGALPAECDGLLARWFRVGGVAVLLPLAALVLMVFKPAL